MAPPPSIHPEARCTQRQFGMGQSNRPVSNVDPLYPPNDPRCPVLHYQTLPHTLVASMDLAPDDPEQAQQALDRDYALVPG